MYATEREMEKNQSEQKANFLQNISLKWDININNMRLLLLMFLLMSLLSATAQEEGITNNKYDGQLARDLGADPIGMRKYVMAFLKAGPVKLTDSTERSQLMRAHLDNIGRMAKEGKLILAGPFMDNQAVRGIYIFAVESMEEAEELTQTDPAIQRGTLVMELHPWYGSAALMALPAIHDKITQRAP